MKIYQLLSFILIALFLFGFQSEEKQKPTIWIIGDSTVKAGQGDGSDGLWGWGNPLALYFDTTKINIENCALGGTSSRTFQTKGLWDKVLEQIKPGDFVLMQFGHNDGGAINDTSRARGTFKGIGGETEEIDNLLTGEHEVVHSYGWYLRKYIQEAKAKGASCVVMSPIPRNDWTSGKVPRNNSSYGLWAKLIAEQEKADFIDLNEKMAKAMEKLGEENVTDVLFFKRDHTHTSAQGAVLAASIIAAELQKNPKSKLKNYILKNPEIIFPPII